MATCHRRRGFYSNGATFPLVEEKKKCSGMEFEFGSIVRDSPFGESIGNSPADCLFLNGKMLPHVFPCQKIRAAGVTVSSISRIPSRASSMSSKDFLGMSSRSNSTNSRSSTCSGRTSDSSDRSMPASMMCYRKKAVVSTRNDNYVAREREKSRGSSCNAMEATYLYGSQRWQFITSAPFLSHKASLRRLKQSERVPELEAKKTREGKKGEGIFRRIVRSFFSSCMQCHAMEPSRKSDVWQGN